ncbi:MAG: hypothetical protein ACE5J5_04575 [Candidatus Hydrothermarchaeales archaeon]
MTILVAAVVIAVVISAGIAAISKPAEVAKPAMAAPQTRVIYVTAIEIKGATTKQELSAPTSNPSDVGKGYGGVKWLSDDKWQVASYIWTPRTIVVNQGDFVRLVYFGVNGNEHKTTIEGYADEFVLNRGRFVEVEFTADKAGIFRITCANHKPNMNGQLVVNARA